MSRAHENMCAGASNSAVDHTTQASQPRVEKELCEVIPILRPEVSPDQPQPIAAPSCTSEAQPTERQGAQSEESSPGGDEGKAQEAQTNQQEQGTTTAEQEQQLATNGGPQDAANEAEALAKAEDFKGQGNKLFGRGLWAEAAAKYNEALDAAPPSAAANQAIYYANLAACCIKMGQYTAAVQNCTEALNLDPTYQKAYMRRCEAFERLDELDHALTDAKKLLELAPDGAWARAKVASLQPRVDERTEKLKTEMMSKLKDLGNTILGKFGLSTDNFKFDKDPNTGSYNIRFER